MISKIKKPVSILLALMMVVSLFTIVPMTVSAAVGDFVAEEDYLTFTAEEAGSSVTLKVNSGGSNLKYDLNGTGLTAYTPGTTITFASAGDYVRFRGKDTRFGSSNHVVITGKVACSGNVMSLMLDDNGMSQGLSNYCFNSMFYGCTGLTSAPELPETDLKDGCYGFMFYGCTNLTKAPALPATNLAEYCYCDMFSGCESLTELPALPATTLAEFCYHTMFYGCSNIRISDEAGTFDGITYSAEYRIPSEGTGTSADSALDDMFSNTGGRFKGTPNINTIYYVPAPAAPVDYYVVGTMNSWDISEDYKMALNENNTSEYWIQNVPLHSGDEIKVVSSTDGSTVQYWYPDGTGNNLVIGEDGYYNVYVAPAGHNTWHSNCILATKQSDLNYVAQIGDNKYETLEAAFAAAQDGNTITLLANCAGNGIKAPQGKFATGLTVDFAGHTYTVDGETVGSTGTETNGFQLLKNNKITFENGIITSEKAKILVQNYSDLTLNNMTLTLNNPNYTSAYTLSNNNGDVVINNTTIKANPAGGFAFDVCRFSSYPSVNVTVKGNSQIYGDVEISASKGDAKEGFSLKLEGGDMSGDIVVDASAKALVGETNKVTKADDFTQTAPADFEWVDNGDGTSSLKAIEYVAQIGTAKYRTLEDAFAAAADGDTITLLANCAGNGIKAPQGKFATNGLTVDFAGHTYTVDGETVGSSGTETQAFQLLKNNKITFKGGTITSTTALMLVQNYSDLTLKDMTLDGSNLVGNNRYTLSNNNGNVVIDGSTITAKAGEGNYAFDVCRYSSYPSVNVTVTGNSTINGDVEISATKGDAKEGFSLKLEDGTMTGDIVVDASAKNLINNGCTVTKAADFEQDAPEGYKWNENNVLVPDYAALVNGTGYMTFAEAAAAANGETITLLKDAPAYVMTPGETLKVAKNGFKFSTPTVEGAYVVNAPAAVEGVITYTVSAAKVAYTTAAGKTTYSASLPTAFSNGTYKLLDDITRTTRMTPGVLASNVTLDLNGHTLTSTAPDYAIVLTRAGSAASPKTFALVDTSEQKGGKLVVNPAADQAIAVSGKYNNVTIGEGVTVDGGCVALTSENQNLTVNGTVKGGNDFAVVTNGKTTKNANITINDGAVVTSNVTAIYLPGTGTTTINGGTIEGKTAIYQKSGTLQINGGIIKGTGAKAEYSYNGNGANATGDAIVVDSCGYPGGTPVLTISGNPTIKSTNGVQIGDYTYQDNTAPKVTATSNTMTLPIGLSWIPTETEGVYTVGAALFVAHSITLDGNIELNFFINPDYANFDDASSAKVKFSWDGNTTEVDLKNPVLSEDGWYKASVELVAAEMANVVHAEVYLNNAKIGEDDYTVREYAEKLYNHPEQYDKKHKPEELRALAKALLNYGAMAQTVFVGDFTVKPEDFANANLDAADKTAYESVTAAQIGAAIQGTASNMDKVADKLGGKFYTSSVFYLNKNTLRLYFTPNKYGDKMPNANAYDGNQYDYYYYKDKADIAAAELDTLQEFKIGGVTFYYSALDYAKAVVESNNMKPEQKNLAKSLFCYNQAANAYFG